MSGYTYAVVEDYYNERVDLVTRVVIDEFIASLGIRDQQIFRTAGYYIDIDLIAEDLVRLQVLMYRLEKELNTTSYNLISASLQKSPKYGTIQLAIETALDAWVQAHSIGNNSR